MTILVRAVITGFGLALGGALFRKVAKKLGFDEPEEKKDSRRDPDPEVTQGTDSGQHQHAA